MPGVAQPVAQPVADPIARRAARAAAGPVHLLKLAVGVRDIAHLRELQAVRTAREPPLRHHTRHRPRRAEEIVAGGSIYWVIGGVLCARQRVLDIRDATWDDGSACAALVLDATIVPVTGRAMRAFQGWRYLAAADAPPDITEAAEAAGSADLPEPMRRALRELCLI